MEATRGSRARHERVAGFGRLLAYGAVAGAIAAVLNAVVYAVASALGAIPLDVEIPNTGGPLPLGAVVIFSFVPAILAAGLLAILGRFVSRPIRVFTLVAVLVFLLSLSTPFSIPGAPFAMILALELMHLVAAVTIVVVLARLGRRDQA